MKRYIGMVVCVSLAAGVNPSAYARLPGTMGFQDATALRISQSPEPDTPNEKEIEVGDFDADGDLDVAIANAYSAFGTRRNKLYRNDSGVLIEVSGTSVIPGFATKDVSRNAFFRDFDGDGWLDIGIINDLNIAGDAGRTKLYMNKQVDGAFDRFEEEGLIRLPTKGGAACGGVSLDFDQDGDMDLYLGNYPGPSQDTMYFNDGSGMFTEVTATHVPSDADYTVDVATADMNGDGKTDLLVSSLLPHFIYYNDLDDAGSEVGDYQYASSTQAISGNSLGQNAMEPGDFDGDGDMDVYWTNADFYVDRVLMNLGNDPSGQAIFQVIQGLPASVAERLGRKATVIDLNHDGRPDVVVMKEDAVESRPTILRNTTFDDAISFVDWTPAAAFPNGQLHAGWHVAAFDVDGDGWKDLLLGGSVGDHLFLSNGGTEVDEASASAALSGSLGGQPVAFSGTIGAEADAFSGPDIPSGAYLSVIVKGCGDFTLRVLGAGGEVLGESDRGGLGIEEVVTVYGAASEIVIEVTLRQACGDSDSDGDVDLYDWLGFAGCAEHGVVGGGGTTAASICDTYDLDGSGTVDFLDYAGFQRRFTGEGGQVVGSYILESLAR